MTKTGSDLAADGGNRQLVRDYDPAPLNAACEMAVRLFDMRAAIVVLVNNDIAQVVASHNLPTKIRSVPWDQSKAPFSVESEFILTDAASNSFAQFVFHEAGLQDVGSLIRVPVMQTPTYHVALLVLGLKPIARPTAKKMKLLADVVAVAQSEIKTIADMLVDQENDITVPLLLNEIIDGITASMRANSLLDSQLRVVAANQPMAKLTGVEAARMVGMTYSDFDQPSADAVNFLYRRALETLKSPPDFEVIITDAETGINRVFRQRITPFSPSDTREYFLLVEAEETTQRVRQIENLSAEIDRDHGIATPSDPSQLFLMDTLVKRRSIRQRKAVSYLTLRSWRQPIRDYQIKALKALKQNIPTNFPQTIATEVAEEVENLFGKAGFKAIVPMPCGHSRGDSCLSLEIARSLGQVLGLPIIQAFIPKRGEGGSHPKKNTTRPPLTLARIIDEPVLLIDDVATSGAHIEEAVALLKPTCRAVMAIAWISGDALGKDSSGSQAD